MKKAMLALLALAGVSLLAGLVTKYLVQSQSLLAAPAHSYMELAQLLVLGAIALGIYGMGEGK